MEVPFLDLKANYFSLKNEIDTAIEEVLEKTAFAGGFAVERFEKNWAAYCGVNHAVGLGSGTAALWAALQAMEIGPGDEVITVSHTFAATVEAIVLAGARPVFVDIDKSTFNMDTKQLEAAATENTKAVIPVHLYGQPVNMDAVLEFARTHELFVIEDACQSHGAEYKRRKTGSMGDVGCFSFYPGKNLGAFGEAGAVVTNNPQLAERMRRFRDHGQTKKYHHDHFGWNERMDGIQGAVLDVKLKYLEQWNTLRRQHAQRYLDRLQDQAKIIGPREVENCRHVWHLFVVRVPQRDIVLRKLKERGIYCGLHYPVPVHRTKAFKRFAPAEGSLPVTETVASSILSLPMYPELSEEQIDYVCKNLIEIAENLTESENA